MNPRISRITCECLSLLSKVILSYVCYQMFLGVKQSNPVRIPYVNGYVIRGSYICGIDDFLDFIPLQHTQTDHYDGFLINV